MLVQHLHSQIGVDQQVVFDLGGKTENVGQAGNEGIVEYAVVVYLFRVVIVDDTDRTNGLRAREKAADLIGIVHKQSHFEKLVIGAVFLGADVGYIEIELAYQREHSGDASGDVQKLEFQQNYAGVGVFGLKIADVGKAAVGFFKLLGRALGVDEQGVGVRGLVVADSGYVDAQLVKALAGLEKGAYVVGHGGDVGFFQVRSPRLCIVSYVFILYHKNAGV